MNPENNKRNSRFHLITRHFANKSDRIFLYSAMNTIPNTFFALFKIVIGSLYLSLWFLTFGGYYLALLGIRIYFLRVYHRLRISTESVADWISEEKQYLFDGALFYAGLGFFFTIVSLTLYTKNQSKTYSQFVALSITTIGFVKMISAIVSWFNTRKLKSPLISYLKALSLADGLLAIVMTQYTLLSYQHSKSAPHTTGSFGIVIGLLLILIGFIIAFRSRYLRTNTSSK